MKDGIATPHFHRDIPKDILLKDFVTFSPPPISSFSLCINYLPLQLIVPR